MSHHLHPDPQNGLNIFYWILWASLFICTKISGFIDKVAAAVDINEINLPQHHNSLLPELSDLIPQVIVAVILAIFSWSTIELMKLIKNKITK
jgi:hypothetical protein